MSGNDITGTLPDYDWVCGATLESLWLVDNDITGSIPSVLADFPTLRTLSLSTNHFTGTVPPFNAEALTILFLHENHLTGTIPQALQQAVNLAAMNLSCNRLSGSFPDMFDGTHWLFTLSLRSNRLTGTLPASLGTVMLAVLELDDNELTGYISQLPPLIVSLDVSNNRFSGLLPTDAFQSPYLVSFIAGVNCFSGTLPVELCHATELTYVGLGGLHAAKACQERIFTESSIDTYYLTTMFGTIPQCYFTSPTIHSLMLTGNGLTGTLPEIVPSTYTLLSLSHS